MGMSQIRYMPRSGQLQCAQELLNADSKSHAFLRLSSEALEMNR